METRDCPFGNEDFVLVDPPYNVLSKAIKIGSGLGVTTGENVKDLVKHCSKGMALRAHGHVSFAWGQLDEWC